MKNIGVDYLPLAFIRSENCTGSGKQSKT
ncbi:uncharacterized protein METZ01_LOCUS487798 [marine metagenome]|uniref:Uncharacterized protein n=1 Tax=marine metagenome TaxID=408172 RepID=A0A383CS52_9ZZZZ